MSKRVGIFLSLACLPISPLAQPVNGQQQTSGEKIHEQNGTVKGRPERHIETFSLKFQPL
jgi:hypothetical protein